MWSTIASSSKPIFLSFSASSCLRRVISSPFVIFSGVISSFLSIWSRLIFFWWVFTVSDVTFWSFATISLFNSSSLSCISFFCSWLDRLSSAISSFKEVIVLFFTCNSFCNFSSLFWRSRNVFLSAVVCFCSRSSFCLDLLRSVISSFKVEIILFFSFNSSLDSLSCFWKSLTDVSSEIFLRACFRSDSDRLNLESCSSRDAIVFFLLSNSCCTSSSSSYSSFSASPNFLSQSSLESVASSTATRKVAFSFFLSANSVISAWCSRLSWSSLYSSSFILSSLSASPSVRPFGTSLSISLERRFTSRVRRFTSKVLFSSASSNLFPSSTALRFFCSFVLISSRRVFLSLSKTSNFLDSSLFPSVRDPSSSL